jgi:hypothetical protein
MAQEQSRQAEAINRGKFHGVKLGWLEEKGGNTASASNAALFARYSLLRICALAVSEITGKSYRIAAW